MKGRLQTRLFQDILMRLFYSAKKLRKHYIEKPSSTNGISIFFTTKGSAPFILGHIVGQSRVRWAGGFAHRFIRKWWAEKRWPLGYYSDINLAYITGKNVSLKTHQATELSGIAKSICCNTSFNTSYANSAMIFAGDGFFGFLCATQLR